MTRSDFFPPLTRIPVLSYTNLTGGQPIICTPALEMSRRPSWIPRNRFDSVSYAPSSAPSQHEKETGEVLETPIPFVTWRSLLLGAFVSIGGIIFGYDTGQISGFLEMDNFKQRFGQLQPDGTYAFSHVRSGLIVSMVRTGHTTQPRAPRKFNIIVSSCPLVH